MLTHRLGHKYWNACGIGIAIVAVAGEANDWAAYIGAEATGWHEQDAVDAAHEFGAKLSEQIARAFFPGIELYYRR